MKSTNLKIIAALLSCILLSSSLIACSSKTQSNTNKTPSSNQSQTQTPNSSQDSNNKTDATASQKQPDKLENSGSQSTNDINVDTYNEKINYYMELVETLQAEIVTLKEENYIEENEYKAKIKELEGTVSNLLDRIEMIVSGNVVTPVDPSLKLPPSSTEQEMDSLTSKNEFTYTVENGEATITKYIGSKLSVEIPQTIDNYQVVAIGESAFQSSDVKNIVIPQTVVVIDWFAFAGCTSLESITIPFSVRQIQYGAFDYCPKSFKIHCEKGSYAEAYAKSWGLTTVAE